VGSKLNGSLTKLAKWSAQLQAAAPAVDNLPMDLQVAVHEAAATTELVTLRAGDGAVVAKDLVQAVKGGNFPWAAARHVGVGVEQLRVAVHLALDELERADEELSIVLDELQGCVTHFANEEAAYASAIDAHERRIMAHAVNGEAHVVQGAAASQMTAEERTAWWKQQCAAHEERQAAAAAAGSVEWLRERIQQTQELREAAASLHAKLVERRAASDDGVLPDMDASLLGALAEECELGGGEADEEVGEQGADDIVA
jgi:hypothetical protein